MRKYILFLFILAIFGGLAIATDLMPMYLKTDATNSGAVNGTTVAAVQLAPQVYQTTIAMSDTPASITYVGPDTNSVGGVKVYDFPEGRILVLGVTVADMTVTPVDGGGFGVTDGGDFSLGTALATGTNLASTGADLCPSTSIDAVTNITDSALAASAQFDGTATAKDAYVNFLVDANDITNNAALTFDATVTITWMKLGDY